MKQLFKTLVVAVGLGSSAVAQANDAGAAIFGLFLGSVITNAYRDSQEQRYYHPPYQPPVVVHPQPPVVVYGHPNRLYHSNVCQSVATFDQWGRYLGHRTYCR